MNNVVNNQLSKSLNCKMAAAKCSFISKKNKSFNARTLKAESVDISQSSTCWNSIFYLKGWVGLKIRPLDQLITKALIVH